MPQDREVSKLQELGIRFVDNDPHPAHLEKWVRISTFGGYYHPEHVINGSVRGVYRGLTKNGFYVIMPVVKNNRRKDEKEFVGGIGAVREEPVLIPINAVRCIS